MVHYVIMILLIWYNVTSYPSLSMVSIYHRVAPGESVTWFNLWYCLDSATSLGQGSIFKVILNLNIRWYEQSVSMKGWLIEWWPEYNFPLIDWRASLVRSISPCRSIWYSLSSFKTAGVAVVEVIIFNLVFRRKYIFLTCNNRRYLKYVLGIYFFTNS